MQTSTTVYRMETRDSSPRAETVTGFRRGNERVRSQVAGTPILLSGVAQDEVVKTIFLVAGNLTGR